jgi:hypothetical protein
MRSFGLLVLAVLALASIGHFWHHLTDDCEASAHGLSHPCPQCAGLHAGLLTEAIQTASAPHLAEIDALFLGELPDRVEQPRGIGAPRAPPLS